MKYLKQYLFNMVTIGVPCFLLLDIEENNLESAVKTTVVLFFLILRYSNLEIEIDKLKENDK